MTTVHGPTAGARKLRTALRAARKSAALTQETVAHAMDWSLSKLIRIETGRVGVSTNDVKALISLYGITDGEERNELVELARLARQKPWWHGYRESLPPDYAQFVGLETEASRLRCYQPAVVPGLLQTEEYARAVLTRRSPSLIQAGDIEARLSVRLARQREVLYRAEPPDVSVVLDEAVLRRTTGGPDVQREQLLHLAAVARLPHVTVQVVPFGAGAYTSAGSFIVLGFPDPADEDVVYLDGALLEHFLDRPNDTAPYNRELDWLCSVGLGEQESLRLITSTAESP